VVVIVVAMPTVIDNHDLFLCVSSAPVTIAVMVAIVVSITLYDNRVLGIRRSRKCDRCNAKSYNSQNKISHFYPPRQDFIASLTQSATDFHEQPSIAVTRPVPRHSVV
jgi:hypothetical protein